MGMKVYIVGGMFAYGNMFERNGFEVVRDIFEADVLCFTGGPDVHPSLYGEARCLRTYSNKLRDDDDTDAYEYGLSKGLSMVGICRGAQFLNVMAGGKLWQDVDHHLITGTHPVTDTVTGITYACSSTHHQMMRPSTEGTIIGVASGSTYRTNSIGGITEVWQTGSQVDVEVVTYLDLNILCFQPHPELGGIDSPCSDYFFILLKRELEIY